ncbi:MAG: MAPEG family protein [Cypionkella sp.]
MSFSATQRGVLAGMVAAVIWTCAVFALAPVWITPAGTPLEMAVKWLCLPALSLLVMIGRIANMRFLNAELIDGQDGGAGSAADRAQRVLRNTTEQCVLVALAWPALAIQLAPAQAGLFPALAGTFLIGRIAFTLGYAKGAAGRAFGFGLTFYPTVVVVIWASLRAVLG